MGKFEAVMLSIALVGVAGMVFVPASGSLALVNELASGVTFFACAVWLVKVALMLFKSGKKKDLLTIVCAAVVLFCLFGGIVFKTVADTAQGTQQTVLYQCDVSRSAGTKGIFSLRYTLRGVDAAGKSYRFPISGADAQDLEGVQTVSIEYYEHSKRIVAFQ